MTRAHAAGRPPLPTDSAAAPSQAEQDLAASERRFQLLVESVTDYAIYMLDPDGIVTNWNSGPQRFKGYAPHRRTAFQPLLHPRGPCRRAT
jgi:PAS domain-containing protein